MTPERLAEIEARAEAIWTVEPFLLQKRIRQSQADIPDLIAEVKRLREIIGELERLTDLYYDAISPVTGKHAFTDGRGNYIHVEENQG